MLFDFILYLCGIKLKYDEIMTTLAQRIKETPMAPYIGLINEMTDEQKQIVVMFINESMKKPKEETMAPMTNAEIIREKYKNLKISPEIQRLRGCMRLTEEEMQDERAKYILGV